MVPFERLDALVPVEDHLHFHFYSMSSSVWLVKPECKGQC